MSKVQKCSNILQRSETETASVAANWLHETTLTVRFRMMHGRNTC